VPSPVGLLQPGRVPHLDVALGGELPVNDGPVRVVMPDATPVYGHPADQLITVPFPRGRAPSRPEHSLRQGRSLCRSTPAHRSSPSASAPGRRCASSGRSVICAANRRSSRPLARASVHATAHPPRAFGSEDRADVARLATAVEEGAAPIRRLEACERAEPGAAPRRLHVVLEGRLLY
jgi:hypothetical protein